MKKITLVGLLLIGSTAFGQITKPSFNRWSIDVSAGANTAIKSFTPGYRTKSLGFYSAEVGARYMMNAYFGFDLNLGFDKFSNNSTSPDFTSSMGRLNFQGNLNLGNMMNFYQWTNRLGVIAHVGVGLANHDSTGFSFFYGKDRLGQLMIGLTPQIKLTNKLALDLDVQYMATTRSHHTVDYVTKLDGYSFDMGTFTYTLGISYYLGGFEQHADWSPTKSVNQEDLDLLRAEMEKIRKNMKDDDNDGVPNYLDNEADTPEGNIVDSHGVTDPNRMDTDRDGIPDAFDACPEEEGKFSTNGCPDGDNDGVADKDDKCPTTPGSIASEGCPQSSGSKVNLNPAPEAIYFDLGHAELKKGETSKLDQLVQIMKNNPSYTLVIKGHADKTGGFELNQNLSKDRATSVLNYLIKQGVDPARLQTVAYGSSFPATEDSSKSGRAKNRRVEFEARN